MSLENGASSRPPCSVNPDKGYEVNAYKMSISTLKTVLVSNSVQFY